MNVDLDLLPHVIEEAKLLLEFPESDFDGSVCFVIGIRRIGIFRTWHSTNRYDLVVPGLVQIRAVDQRWSANLLIVYRRNKLQYICWRIKCVVPGFTLALNDPSTVILLFAIIRNGLNCCKWSKRSSLYAMFVYSANFQDSCFVVFILAEIRTGSCCPKDRRIGHSVTMSTLYYPFFLVTE